MPICWRGTSLHHQWKRGGDKSLVSIDSFSESSAYEDNMHLCEVYLSTSSRVPQAEGSDVDPDERYFQPDMGGVRTCKANNC